MKMTNMNALKYVMTNCELPADVRDRMWAMYATLENRAVKAKLRERKPTAKELAKQEQNAELAQKVYDSLTDEGQLCATLAEQHEVSTAKMAAILRMLSADGRATCETVKRKSMWRRATAADVKEEGE